MKKIVFYTPVLLLIHLIISCDSEYENPCAKLVKGVYQYPEFPKDHSLTREQMHQYIDLPQDIRNCISTDGLIESCLTYPEIRLIDAGSSPQKGYNLVFSMFSGLGELEQRTDASDQLLVKYESIDPLKISSFEEVIEAGRYSSNLRTIEIIISQYNFLNKLTNQQKKMLGSRARSVYLLKKEKADYYGLFGLSFTAAILGRLMKVDKYPTFMETYNPRLQEWDVVEHYWPTTFETTETIYAISEDYLNSLN
ncbi:MAG: hypothetical protein ABS46_10535 [Cytophagaceae bacterium SCN 52-12]|nr:MAG: hypothetical protein ABS46_10535 [Cytophagaceae bacterium SCN 52-12]